MFHSVLSCCSFSSHPNFSSWSPQLWEAHPQRRRRILCTQPSRPLRRFCPHQGRRRSRRRRRKRHRAWNTWMETVRSGQNSHTHTHARTHTHTACVFVVDDSVSCCFSFHLFQTTWSPASICRHLNVQLCGRRKQVWLSIINFLSKTQS